MFMAELQKKDSFVEVCSEDAAVAGLEASAVLKLELHELLDWCEKFEIDNSDFVADSEFQSALLEAIKQRGQHQPSPPPLTTFAASFAQGFRLKRRGLFRLVDMVQNFVESETVRPWLKKLRLPQMPAWMTAKDFKRAKDVASKVKPLLLFAGSTSCGKSTLLNALLGIPLLPTSHNAATSTLCEIKFSSNGKKFAVLHIREGQTRKQQEVDLSNQEGIKLFSQFTCSRSTERMPSVGFSQRTSGGLLPSAGAVPQGDVQREPEKVCVKAEIYWPLEFLRDFSLVDSPGVTEEEGLSSARQMTEQFQKEYACGYVYVLDGTRAAEEAAQVGGLLKAVVKATKSPPPAGCAIFVVNKWDLVVQQLSDSEQTEFLQRLAQCIEQRWPGFDADQQLVTMNAKIAAQAQELGHITVDIQKLCDKIQQILPSAVEHLLLKPLSSVNELLGQVEQSIDGTVRFLHLPVEQQLQKHKRDSKQLSSLRESQTEGSLTAITLEVNQKIDELVLELAHYLKSGEAFEVVTQCTKKSSQEEIETSLDAENVQYIVEEGFTEAICQFPKIDVFRNWALSTVAPVAQRIVGELARVRGFSAQVKQTSLEEMISGQIDSSRVERVQYVVGAAALALPINWPGILLGGVVYALGGDKVGTMIMKLLCPGAWVFAGLNKKLFWDTTKKVYNDLVQKFCDNNYKKLHQYVKSLLENTVEPVGLICREIPKCIQIMESELKTRVEQDLGSAPSFSEILQACREVKGKLSAYMVAQKIHKVDIGQLDLKTVKNPVALVGRVSLVKKGEAMLKRLPEPINDRNADELLKRMTVSR
jgi:energy-coupling factor transporter ATP-binding protein EcfA2